VLRAIAGEIFVKIQCYLRASFIWIGCTVPPWLSTLTVTTSASFYGEKNFYCGKSCTSCTNMNVKYKTGMENLKEVDHKS